MFFIAPEINPAKTICDELSDRGASPAYVNLAREFSRRADARGTGYRSRPLALSVREDDLRLSRRLAKLFRLSR